MFYVYQLPDAVDFWTGAQMIDNPVLESEILERMPEEPRIPLVLQVFFPYKNNLEPIYLCKAENNGTTYMFMTRALEDYFKDILFEGRF